MKKHYSEPELELIAFSFESLMAGDDPGGEDMRSSVSEDNGNYFVDD